MEEQTLICLDFLTEAKKSRWNEPQQQHKLLYKSAKKSDITIINVTILAGFYIEKKSFRWSTMLLCYNHYMVNSWVKPYLGIFLFCLYYSNDFATRSRIFWYSLKPPLTKMNVWFGPLFHIFWGFHYVLCTHWPCLHTITNHIKK